MIKLEVDRTIKVFSFLLDRLEHKYAENPNYDYMLAGREIVNFLKTYDLYECPCGHEEDNHVHYCPEESKEGSCSCTEDYIRRDLRD